MPFVDAAGHRLDPRTIAAATGCAALVYSRRGYGQSEAAPAPWPLTFMHDEARRVLPALLAVEGIDDAILVGRSDGASVALLYAGELGQHVRGVVALAPHVFVEDVCVASIRAFVASVASVASVARAQSARP